MKENRYLNDAAVEYASAGLSVIPADPATKRPVGSWKAAQSKATAPESLAGMNLVGIGIVAGWVSGNLEVLDFDHKRRFYAEWKRLVDLEAPGLTDVLVWQETQSGGCHGIYRVQDFAVPGNQKLAYEKIVVPGPGEHLHDGKKYPAQMVDGQWYIFPCMIETRGEGGQFLVSPTPGYEIESGSLGAIPTITAKGRNLVVRAARALDRSQARPRQEPRPEIDGTRPGDWFNENTDPRDILLKHGWTDTGIAKGEYEHWRRPGKDQGWSASLINGRLFRVFTSNAAPFEADQVYPPFSVYALLEHGGDFSAAARAIRARPDYPRPSPGPATGQTPHDIPGDPGPASQPRVSPWDHPFDLTACIGVAPPSIRWALERRIVHGRGFVLTGVGGSSKTTALKQLAVGFTCGRLGWDWKPLIFGRAMLVLTEDVADDIHRSFHGICAGMNLTQEEIRTAYSRLIPYPMAGKDCILVGKNKDGNLYETQLLHDLERKIKEIGDVVFVGFDPALSITEGDELDQGHQRFLGRTIDNLAVRTGATCCLVSHASKASLQKEELDSHNSRGGGAITDVVRGEFSMRTMTAKEAKLAGITEIEERKRHVQLVGTKGNLLPPEAYVPVWLRRDETGTLSQADLDFGAGTKGPCRTDLRALDVLNELSHGTTPALADWRGECLRRGLIKAGLSEDGQVTAMKRIVGNLRKAGLIEAGHGRGIWVPVIDEDDIS